MKKLLSYMKKNNTTLSAVAKAAGIPYVTMYSWKRGVCLPSIANAMKVEKATKGGVTLYDWV